MAKRKHKGGGMSTERKMLKKGVSVGGKVLGGVVAFGGVIAAAQANIRPGNANLNGFTHDVAYHYSGYDSNTGAFNIGQTFTGVLEVGVGYGIAKLFSWFAKSL